MARRWFLPAVILILALAVSSCLAAGIIGTGNDINERRGPADPDLYQVEIGDCSMIDDSPTATGEIINTSDDDQRFTVRILAVDAETDQLVARRNLPVELARGQSEDFSVVVVDATFINRTSAPPETIYCGVEVFNRR